jgi:hypothetical protein
MLQQKPEKDGSQCTYSRGRDNAQENWGLKIAPATAEKGCRCALLATSMQYNVVLHVPTTHVAAANWANQVAYGNKQTPGGLLVLVAHIYRLQMPPYATATVSRSAEGEDERLSMSALTDQGCTGMTNSLDSPSTVVLAG